MAGFICGIYAATSGLDNPWSILPYLLSGALVTELILWHYKTNIKFLIASALIAGFFYSVGYGFLVNQNQTVPVSGAVFQASGRVAEVRAGLDSQRIFLSLQPPQNGRLDVLVGKFPELRYGDQVSVKGKITAIPNEKHSYALRHQLIGSLIFPEVLIENRGGGNPVKRKLEEAQQAVKNTLRKILPAEESSFVAGLLLGDTSGFSKNFRDSIRKAGVSHIVALSGYNITIIIQSVALLLLGIVPRRAVFALTILVALGFVIMTGADASIVRAAIMALVVGLASQTEKIYSARNAIALTGLVMLLINPYLLLGDIGFQLSFLALIGIFYLAPALRKIFHLGFNSGVWHWRENAVNTIAAQAAVFPILAMSFKTISLVSILANVIILPLIPLTMLLSAATLAVYVLNSALGQLLAELLKLVMRAEIKLIDFLSANAGAIQINALSEIATVFYFFALLAIVFYGQKKLTTYES